jgi:hypothetical protein
MTRPALLSALLLGSVALGTPATAKVFFRAAPSPLPAAGKTGIEDLVLVWPLRDSSVVARLRSEGYHVWLECNPKDLAKAVALADRAAAAGVIIANIANSSPSPATDEIHSYAAAHKNLTFRVLIAGGKQPQLKGRLVVERDGVLQVSSPSTQPWLDSNLATVRLAQSTYPDSLPIMYDFRWSASEVPPGAWHPDAGDYALAIAESDAIHSDVVIDLPVSLQEALKAENPEAWSLWKSVMPYLDFASRAQAAKAQPVASLGAVVDNTQASYEPINLLARHNLSFEAVRPAGLTPARLSNWNSAVVFCSLGTAAVALFQDFAAKGGIVIFVNSHDKFPWHSNQPFRRESHSTTYKIGAGQIVELGEPVIDPENFARDLRRLIGRERSALALWNSLTTLVAGYREPARSETTLYLVNYADRPDNVQVQVKGHFRKIRLEAPGEPCCLSLPFVERGDFTEFTIPSLRIAARVRLDSDGKSSAAGVEEKR